SSALGCFRRLTSPACPETPSATTRASDSPSRPRSSGSRKACAGWRTGPADRKRGNRVSAATASGELARLQAERKSRVGVPDRRTFGEQHGGRGRFRRRSLVQQRDGGAPGRHPREGADRERRELDREEQENGGTVGGGKRQGQCEETGQNGSARDDPEEQD